MALNKCLILALFITITVVNSFFSDEREKQTRLNRWAHGMPEEEEEDENDLAWRQVFTDELKQNLEHDHPEESDGDSEDVFRGHFVVDTKWPFDRFPIGQVGGVAVDGKGLLHILHRAKRVWGPRSFNEFNEYVDHDKQKIQERTVLVVNATDGSIVRQWGNNLFVLPHGLEIDSKGNLYVTDVALHQVFKFEPDKEVPSLILGRAFEPASTNDDHDRFCQPTDIAVAGNGDFYISDGYCNSRIMKYDRDGKFLDKFGMDDSLVPHGLALVEEIDYLCVADRENMRVLCYKAGLHNPNITGRPAAQFINSKIGRIYGITYSPVDGLLYGVTGPTGILKSQGFTLDVKNSEAYDTNVVDFWSPYDLGFTSPHNIAVSRDGESVYIGEIDPPLVWKMEKDE